jgi:carbamoyltransferase
MKKTTSLIRKKFPRAKYQEVYHHLAHAASSFFLSPYHEAAVLVVDGLGELTSTSIGHGEGGKIRLLNEQFFPHSLGLLYSLVTDYLGFEANSDEYKVMGLASYGKPAFYESFSNFVQLTADGMFRLNLEYFNPGFRGPNYLGEKFYKTFGPVRQRGEAVTERHADIAASLQKCLEEAVFHIANHLHNLTGQKQLCLAGGVALNCSMNGKLIERTPFKQVFIQPAANDPGTAIGAAYYVYHQTLGHRRDFQMTHAYLGPEYSNEEIKKALDLAKQMYAFFEEPELLKYAAKLLAEGKIVGWFQGRMEWGPRALGNRSILADPTRSDMKDIINYYVKHREEFRPFAPAVVEERAKEFFEVSEPSPFMLFACRVKEEAKNKIPAVTHIDGTARVQTISRDVNARFYNLIVEFERLRGVPVLLNTSFNIMGEPIVCTPRDAVRCFAACGMDALVIGNFLLEKGGIDSRFIEVAQWQ